MGHGLNLKLKLHKALSDQQVRRRRSYCESKGGCNHKVSNKWPAAWAGGSACECECVKAFAAHSFCFCAARHPFTLCYSFRVPMLWVYTETNGRCFFQAFVNETFFSSPPMLLSTSYLLYIYSPNFCSGNTIILSFSLHRPPYSKMGRKSKKKSKTNAAPNVTVVSTIPLPPGALC